MSIQVETLEKLERRITLTLPTDTIRSEVESRLKRLARTVKIDGFRPGKVPMNVVAQRYGYSVHYEVVNDKVGEAFSSAANEAKLRVAGQPRITEKEGAAEGQLAFDAVFEVFPEVVLGDLTGVQIERVSAEVDDSAVNRTLDILRKQRRTFSRRPADEVVVAGDRVTVDFEGKIDGEAFEGGKGSDFQFLLGEGQMLKEFEDAVAGMRVGESKTFPLAFPADYHGKDVAGKQADFMLTIKSIEASQMPAVDAEFAKALGVGGDGVDGLLKDVRANLERELKFRMQSRNKAAVMDALVANAQLDLPTSIVKAETDRLIQSAREDMKQRGIKDADKAPIPEDLFTPQAEKRVRVGLVVAELVRAHGLEARPEQIKAHIDELASSYERPEEVVRWYFGDRRRMAEVEAIVVENNVTEHVLSRASVTDRKLGFDEIMGQQQGA